MTAALVAVRPIRHVAIVSALPKVARRVMGGPALNVGGVSMLGGVVDRFYDARCWFSDRWSNPLLPNSTMITTM